MVRIIFKSGELIDCENVEKIYISNDEVTIETKHIRDIKTDFEEDDGK